MKKIFIGVFVLALLVSTTVYAERGRGGLDDDQDDDSQERKVELLKQKFKNASSTKDVLKNVDVTCAAEAVAKREDAIMASWSAFNTKINEILEDRKARLVDAWSIENTKERKAALKEVWKESKEGKKAASKEYKEKKKGIWKEFKQDAKECGGTEGSEASGESDSTEKVEV